MCVGGGENEDENINKQDAESKNYVNLETNKQKSKMSGNGFKYEDMATNNK